MYKQLTRQEFNEVCLERDGFSCVFCKSTDGIHVHHIIDRRLFLDGSQGYFEANGASVCEPCHIKCEMTVISCEEAREACGIHTTCLPEDFYSGERYDKWGNTILLDGNRTPGPVFYDESVQKILKRGNALDKFVSYVKYGRTRHLPFSPGVSSDDKVLKDTSCFEGKEVVLLHKRDGENTSIYPSYLHARSIDSANHESRNWVKNFASTFQYDIPSDMRLCGENVFAKHSIYYEDLDTYFYGFSVWKTETCLSWDESVEWMQLWGVTPIEELYRGIYDEKKIRNILEALDTDKIEGGVLRLAGEFKYSQFSTSVAKWVRKNHIATPDANHHWRFKQVVPNKLRT